MKRNNILYAIYLVLAVMFFGSCSSMNSLTMTVTEPAPVYLPADIKTVGIVDRSLPIEENTTMDKIDKILTVEGKDLDKNGAKQSIVGLSEALSENPRFSEVNILDSLNEKSTGMGVFPSPLSWETINNICNETKVDALFVLSVYDTDARVNYDMTPVQINAPLGISVPAVEHHAVITTNIKMGWRLYDPLHKSILDEHIMKDNVVLSGTGINPLKAFKAVMGRKDAVMEASKNMGRDYSYRIMPYKIRVRREYYVRGTENFKIGKRKAQTGNWDGAAENWEMELNNSKRKIAGRACYNMAIINEINGELDTAIEWASKSFTDYKNKEAIDYLNILKYRLQRDNQLKQETSY